MEFGDVPIGQAEGAVLAHSVSLTKGRLRKGKILDHADMTALRAAGHSLVTVARFGKDDVAEDSAALALAHALVPDPAAARLQIRAVGTGRVNIYADAVGVAGIDAALIDKANLVDPMITVATVPVLQRMDRGGMVATVKIISYAVPHQALDAACKTAFGALRLWPAILSRAALVQTFVTEEDGEKGHAAVKLRLDRLGVGLVPKIVVPHQMVELKRGLSDGLKTRPDVLLILTGSATSDIRDIAPAAVREAGGEVVHFGMPVDPGNLLFLGRIGATPVIGLPGCARSPALNGADWILERICCGIPVSGPDIQKMGVGGLLKEIPSRPRPREV